jgi:hypothetical protein
MGGDSELLIYLRILNVIQMMSWFDGRMGLIYSTSKRRKVVQIW